MPKVHHIKARKDYPDEGIKKGEMYYKWSIKTGPVSGFTRKSKTAPKPSQLTQSEFWGTVYSLQETDQPAFENLDDERENIKSELEQLRDDCDDKFNNMPEGLQQGDTGQLLETRRDSVESAISDLESVDIPDEESVKSESDDEMEEADLKEESEEDRDKRHEEALQTKADEIWTEIMDALSGISD
jgi:hypothetical protein